MLVLALLQRLREDHRERTECISFDRTRQGMLTARAIDPRETTSEDVASRFEVHVRFDGTKESEFELTPSEPGTPLSVKDVLAWCETEFGSDADFDLYVVLPPREPDDARPLVQLH
jgi:hypothetical protein